MKPVDRRSASHSAALQVTVHQAGDDVVVVEAAGEVDLSTHHQVEAALLDALAPPPTILIIDLSNVTFCNVTGINALIDAQQRAEAVNTDLRIVSTHSAVRRLLTVTAVDSYLNLYPNRSSAHETSTRWACR